MDLDKINLKFFYLDILLFSFWCELFFVGFLTEVLIMVVLVSSCSSVLAIVLLLGEF